MSIGPLTRFNYNRTAAGPAGKDGNPGVPGADGSSFYKPLLDPSSAAVVPGDSIVSANQALNANVTRAVTASIQNSVSVPGVVIVGGNPNTLITVQVSGVCPNSITGLGTGSVAKVAVNGTTGKLMRVLVPDGSEKIVGSCDGQGNLTLAPVDHVGAHAHHVINVSAAPYNCVGDGVTDCYAGLQAALNNANATGRAVYLPGQGNTSMGPGGPTNMYAISKPLSLQGIGVQIFGDTYGTSLVDSTAYFAGIKAAWTPVTGTAAKVTAVSGNANANELGVLNILTVSNLSGLTANNIQVGDTIVLTNCATGNVGAHTVISINLGAQSLTCHNKNADLLTDAPAATSPDYGTGGVIGTPTMHWVIKQPILRLYGEGCLIKGIRFEGNNIASCGVDATAPVSGNVCSDNFYDSCCFIRSTYGVKIGDYGPNATYQANCDYQRFHHCQFTSINFACVYVPNSLAQSREHTLIDCVFTHTPYGFWAHSSGVYVDRLGCGKVSNYNDYLANVAGGTDIVGNAGAVFRAGFFVPTAVRDLVMENCGRIYEGGGSSAQLGSFVVDGIRHDSQAGEVPPDSEIIRCNSVGGMVLKNGIIGTGNTGLQYKIAILNTGPVGGTPPHVVLQNIVMARNDFNLVQARGDTGGGGTWFSLGCQVNDGVFLQAVPDGYHIAGTYLTPNAFSVQQLLLPAQTGTLPVTAGINHLPDIYSSAMEYSGSTGAFSIGSLISNPRPLEGREIEFNYYGTHAMTILHHDGTEAVAANRFDCPGGANIVFPAGNACFFARWSTTKGMWEVTGLGPTYQAGGAPSGAAGGSLAGTYPNPTIAASGVSAATYGDSTHVAQVTLGADGRVTSASSVAISATGGPPTGAAGGALTGTYPNPGIATVPVASGGTGDTSLTANSLLVGNGTSPVLFIAPVAAGKVLHGGGVGNAPLFSTWTLADPGIANNSLISDGTNWTAKLPIISQIDEAKVSFTFSTSALPFTGTVGFTLPIAQTVRLHAAFMVEQPGTDVLTMQILFTKNGVAFGQTFPVSVLGTASYGGGQMEEKNVAMMEIIASLAAGAYTFGLQGQITGGTLVSTAPRVNAGTIRVMVTN